jgi:hypothetical protein
LSFKISNSLEDWRTGRLDEEIATLRAEPQDEAFHSSSLPAYYRIGSSETINLFGVYLIAPFDTPLASLNATQGAIFEPKIILTRSGR